MTYLARNQAVVESRTLGHIEVVIRQAMYIHRVQPFMPLKEPIPQRRQWQRPPRHEHERHLRHSRERILLCLGHQRSPPKELVISHAMHQMLRAGEPLHAQALPVAARGVHRLGEEELRVGVEVSREMGAKRQAQDDPSDENHQSGDGFHQRFLLFRRRIREIIHLLHVRLRLQYMLHLEKDSNFRLKKPKSHRPRRWNESKIPFWRWDRLNLSSKPRPVWVSQWYRRCKGIKFYSIYWGWYQRDQPRRMEVIEEGSMLAREFEIILYGIERRYWE